MMCMYEALKGRGQTREYKTKYKSINCSLTQGGGHAPCSHASACEIQYLAGFLNVSFTTEDSLANVRHFWPS